MKILKLIGKVFLGLIGLILLFVLYIQFGYNVKYDRPYLDPVENEVGDIVREKDQVAQK